MAALSTTSSWVITPATDTHTIGDGTTDTTEVCVTVPEDAVAPKVDIYLLADTTGSMGAVLDSVKAGAAVVTSALYDDLALLGIDTQIGVGNYKDFPHDAYAFDHQLLPVPAAAEASVQAMIAGWFATGGSDIAEGQFFALDRLANDADPAGGTIGWRPDAKKVIVWFGDAPAHDSVCNAINGPTVGYDITEGTVTADLLDEDITVIAISTNTGVGGALNDNPVFYSFDYNSVCGPAGGSPGQADRITAATGGAHIAGVNSATIVSSIVNAVKAEVGTLGSLEVELSPELVPYGSVLTPAVADPEEGGTYCFDVEFFAECDDYEPTIHGAIDVLADGAEVGDVDITLYVESCCPASDEKLGTATGWNLFILGNFNGWNSDVQGRAAVGGDGTFLNYGIGSKVVGGNPTLAVGDDLSATNAQVYGGDADVGDVCTTSSFGIPSGVLGCGQGAGAFHAGDHATEMLEISEYLADLPTNGTTATTSWGGVFLTGSDPALNVFTLNLGALGFDPWVWNGWINTFSINVPAGSTVVINVIGNTNPLFKNGGFTLIGASKNKIVWNFEAQTLLDVKSVSVPGSILAPMATVHHNAANIEGTLIAWDADGYGQYHNFPFYGDICP